MFASAYPFGATITSLFIYIESKQDCFKLETCCRRPFARKSFDIGVWEMTLDLFTIVSIFTNIILCCYSSNQIDTIFPWMKVLREDSATSILTVFSIEHILIVFVLTIRYLFNTNPAWLNVLLKRKVHKKHEERLVKRIAYRESLKK